MGLIKRPGIHHNSRLSSISKLDMESVHYDSALLHTTATELPISFGTPPCHGAVFADPNSQNQLELTTIDCHSSIPIGRCEFAITISNADTDENIPPPPFSAPNQRIEQFVSPNSQRQSESTTINMENSNQDIADLRFTEIHNYRGILYLLYAGALVVMYPSLTQLVQLKFQNNKQSPFETLSFFANTAVIAYTIAVPTSLILFYMKVRFKTSIKERNSTTYYVYTILKGVFCFFGIVAPLSLVLVLLLHSHV